MLGLLEKQRTVTDFPSLQHTNIIFEKILVEFINCSVLYILPHSAQYPYKMNIIKPILYMRKTEAQ